MRFPVVFNLSISPHPHPLQDMLVLTHQRAKVSLRMDQPLAALQLYHSAAEKHPGDTGLLLGQARIQEAVGQHAHALALYQQVRHCSARAASNRYSCQRLALMRMLGCGFSGELWLVEQLCQVHRARLYHAMFPLTVLDWTCRPWCWTPAQQRQSPAWLLSTSTATSQSWPYATTGAFCRWGVACSSSADHCLTAPLALVTCDKHQLQASSVCGSAPSPLQPRLSAVQACVAGKAYAQPRALCSVCCAPADG